MSMHEDTVLLRVISNIGILASHLLIQIILQSKTLHIHTQTSFYICTSISETHIGEIVGLKDISIF